VTTGIPEATASAMSRNERDSVRSFVDRILELVGLQLDVVRPGGPLLDSHPESEELIVRGAHALRDASEQRPRGARAEHGDPKHPAQSEHPRGLIGNATELPRLANDPVTGRRRHPPPAMHDAVNGPARDPQSVCDVLQRNRFLRPCGEDAA